MKTIKSQSTVYEIEGRDTTIIAYCGGVYFLRIYERWGNRIAEYSIDEMMDEYGLSILTLKNIADQLN